MEWARYLALGVGPKKRALIGGNWKCNGTVAEVKTMVHQCQCNIVYCIDSTNLLNRLIG